jgi:hypothetical protein
MLPEHDRRTFLTTIGGAAALASTSAAAAAQAPSTPAGGIDITWFDAFKGRHKQVFDLGSFDLSLDTPLRQLVTFLAAHQQVSRLEPPTDINALVGISHRSFPMNATDGIWKKYGLGEHYRIKDPATGQPSERNIFVDGPVAGPATVAALQARGVVFWQCRFSIAAIARELAPKTGAKAEEIEADLIAGLRPGVRMVPAHTWAIGFVQERGFTYMKL